MYTHFSPSACILNKIYSDMFVAHTARTLSCIQFGPRRWAMFSLNKLWCSEFIIRIFFAVAVRCGCWIFSICSIITTIIMPLMMITKYVESKWTEQSMLYVVVCMRDTSYKFHIYTLHGVFCTHTHTHSKKTHTQTNPTLFMACIGQSTNNALAPCMWYDNVDGIWLLN